MAISSPRLRRLDSALAYLPPECGAMLLSELDGYVAGILVCPEPIPPEEWMPLIWTAEDETEGQTDSGEGAGPLFEDEREAAWYAELVMGHYDAITRTLARAPGRYEPFLEEDASTHEIMWELWIEGFGTAMALRPESWAQIFASDDEATVGELATMITLVDIARDESDLEREDIDALTEDAPRLIPVAVEALNRWRLAHGAPPALIADAAPPAKIGRNDPCPCGSGKKYKKCCGANA